jgi:alkanesulfonate monooxygenase SsuD/methylene tetrahydromethanopterin reductase-like flavin-dependent oxidoreductase (luciferase family)
MTVFGVHAGLQHTTTDELRSCGRASRSSVRLDLGVGPLLRRHGKPDDAACLEAVAVHAASACTTSKVRCGSLVYSVGYRHPAVLAKAITAIDHLSGGRADMGIGAGWAVVEYEAYGIPFPGVKTRMDQLEEGIQVLRGLLHDDVTSFEGEWFTVKEARNEPRPLQAKLPIWIGGGGEKRTLKIAAQYATGGTCRSSRPTRSGTRTTCSTSTARQSVATRRRSSGRSTSASPGPRRACTRSSGRSPSWSRGGVLSGSDEQILDTIGKYVEAGADQVNIALRAPFDVDALERFSAALSLH